MRRMIINAICFITAFVVAVPAFAAMSAPLSQQQAMFSSPAYQKSVHGQSVGLTLTYFNLAALGCGKHTTFKTGDAWRVVRDADGQAMSFSVTGTDHVAGHDVAVIAIKAGATGPSSSYDLNGTVDYDPSARLLVAFHEAMTSSNSVNPGTATSNMDITLQQ